MIAEILGSEISLFLPILGALAFCLIMSFFLSGMEAGLFELSRLRVRRMVRDGDSSARRLQRFLDDPEDCLWTILVGNTLANSFAVLLTLLILRDLFQRDEQLILYWVIFSLGGLLFYTGCELLPKMLFRQYPDRICLFLSRPFGLAHRILSPLVEILKMISHAVLTITGGRTVTRRMFGSREELRQVMREASESLTPDERVMIDKVLDLQNIPVRDIAKSLENTNKIDTDMTVLEVLTLMEGDSQVRIPVWEQTNGDQRIAGLANLRQLSFLSDDELNRPVGHFLESGYFLDEDIRLEVLLQIMRRSGQRMVIILDKNKKEMGVVSLPDIMGMVFGEAGM